MRLLSHCQEECPQDLLRLSLKYKTLWFLETNYYLFVLTKHFIQSDGNSLWSLKKSQLEIFRLWRLSYNNFQNSFLLHSILPVIVPKSGCSKKLQLYTLNISQSGHPIHLGTFCLVVQVSRYPEICLTLFSANLCFWHPKFVVKNSAMLSCGRKKIQKECFCL